MLELKIPMPGGAVLICGPGEEYEYGGYLTIADAEGNEILHWASSEWEEEPESVIGAALQAAVRPLAELLAGRVLRAGVWELERPQSEANHG